MEKKRAIILSEKHLVQKHNTLNEIRNTNMTISQMRLFAIYVSKLHSKDKNTREVTFTLDEYTRIMQFKQTNITRLEETATELLKIVVKIRKEKKEGDKYREFEAFQLFKRFKLDKNENGEWFVTIDCHDDMIDFLFDLNHYVKYQLWNILQLNSFNQQRMYELLKQYEKAGFREISVTDLREFLAIKPEEYPRWERFKTRVLDVAQVALAQNTDIKFTWEAVRGRGKGGKIQTIKFYIEKNNSYIRQHSFDEFLQEQVNSDIIGDIKEFECSKSDKDEIEHTPVDIITFLSEACNDEFSREEIAVLHSLITKIIPFSGFHSTEIAMFNYLDEKYRELTWRATQSVIKNRFGYLKKIIESGEHR